MPKLGHGLGLNYLVTRYTSFAPPFPVGLLRDLVAHWKLDELSGTRYDSTANHNDLTDNNSVGYAVGKIGNAAAFDGSPKWLENDAIVVSSGNFSFSCWIQVDAGGSLWGISSIGRDGNANNITLYSYDGFGPLLFVAEDTEETWVGAEQIELGTWFHVVIVVDRTSGVWKRYFNGGAPLIRSSSLLGLAVDGIFLGRSKEGQYHNGLIDSASFWSRVISDAEVATLYNNGNGLDYPFVPVIVSNSLEYFGQPLTYYSQEITYNP